MTLGSPNSTLAAVTSGDPPVAYGATAIAIADMPINSDRRHGMKTFEMHRAGHRIGLLAAAAMLLSACSAGGGLFGTTGSGPVTTETRETAAFTKVEASGGIRVTVRIGPAQPAEVRAQENILPLIATDVEGTTLRIRGTGSFTTTEGVEVTVVTPALDGISLSGGSNAHIEGLDADRLEAELSGGSVLTATGVAASVTLTASGGSRAELVELTATTVAIDLSGGSTATVQASDEVSGSSSGGARATVVGDAEITVETSSGGSASRR